MLTNPRIPSICMGNPNELFTQRLLGKDYKEAFRDENKMCKIVASITCATALAGSDGSMKDGMVTIILE